jgi:RNA polymerase sigma-70 factor (ECF subfamily)
MAADPAVGRADAGLRTKASPEAQAAQLLFERHGDRVLAYCRRRLSSPEEAEDALQTTYLYACRGLQRGVVPETEIAWLLKIAHNVCLSHWDSDRRRRLELVRDPERIEAAAPAATGARDDLHALEAALAGLTDLQRGAILLREWRGLSYAEIAAELELSQAAVETLIFRARRALATSLEEQEVEGSRTRTRLVRGLDLGGLLAGLKSLLGGGGAAKLAATGLTVGAAVLAGSIPDVPKRAAAEPPVSAPRSVGAPADPATAPSARAAAAAAEARSAPKPAAAKTERAEKRKPQRTKRAPAKPGQSPPQQPTVGETVGQVTTGLGETVNGTVDAVTGTVNGTVGTVTETVNGTVGTVTETVNGTVGTLPQVVAPTLEIVNGVLGGNGALLP